MRTFSLRGRLVLLAGLVGLLVLLLATPAIANAKTQRQGVVLHSASVNYCPAVYCPAITTYPTGKHIVILAKVKGWPSAGGHGQPTPTVYWYKVRVGHRDGYILADAIRVLKHRR